MNDNINLHGTVNKTFLSNNFKALNFISTNSKLNLSFKFEIKSFFEFVDLVSPVRFFTNMLARVRKLKMLELKTLFMLVNAALLT